MYGSNRRIAFVASLLCGCIAAGLPGEAGAFGRRHGGATSRTCSTTAWYGLAACYYELNDDRWTGVGVCLNESDADEREECLAEVASEAEESGDECSEVFGARLALCEALGEDPYDPDFEPADFVSDFTSPPAPNPWYPLAVGNTWRYEGGDETVEIVVKDETKSIEGVTCITVNDVASEEGVVLEDTDDWVALRLDGTVFYCGEISMNFEVFEGDDPETPELVDVEGSWKTGRDGAKPGVLMFAAPEVGRVYRQEWAFGDAEDAAEVLSSDYDFADGGELNEAVPAELAQLLCDHDCVVSRDFTPLEPDANERKYYAPGVGLFLEVDLESGEIVQLVDCNFDARCDALPEP